MHAALNVHFDSISATEILTIGLGLSQTSLNGTINCLAEWVITSRSGCVEIPM